MNREEQQNILLRIQEEIQHFMPQMASMVDLILDEDVSKYPILVVHHDAIELGINFVQRSEETGRWSINASTLEEFATKQLVQDDKVQDFIKAYKDPSEFLCLFVLSDLGAKFIFTPRLK